MNNVRGVVIRRLLQRKARERREGKVYCKKRGDGRDLVMRVEKEEEKKNACRDQLGGT